MASGRTAYLEYLSCRQVFNKTHKVITRAAIYHDK